MIAWRVLFATFPCLALGHGLLWKSAASRSEERERARVRSVLKKPSELQQDEKSYKVSDKSGGHAFAREFGFETALACNHLITDHTRPPPSADCKAHDSIALELLTKGLSSNCRNGSAEMFLEQSEVVERFCAGASGLPHFENHCLNAESRAKLVELLGMVASPQLGGCPTCAVVGSSGNVLGSKMGSAIDNHEVVIRFGCAPTEGFKEDVGGKTTHRFLYPEAMAASGPQGDGRSPCGGVVNWTEEHSVALVRLYKPGDVFWWVDLLEGKDWHRDSYTVMHPFWREVPDSQGTGFLPPAAVLHPQWMEQVAEGAGLSPDEDTASQGIMGVLLALTACRSVDIYGFGTQTLTGDSIDMAHMHYFE